MKYFVKLSTSFLCAIVLIGFDAHCITFAQASSSNAQQSNPEYTFEGIGIFGGADIRSLSLQSTGFTGFPTCCVQNFGQARITAGWAVGGIYERTLTNWLVFDVRGAVLSHTAQFSQQQQVLTGIALNGGQNVAIQHTMELALLNVVVEPSLKIRLLPIPITTTFAPSLYLQLGANAGVPIIANFRYEERIADENTQIFFLDANGKATSVRNVQNTRIPDLTPLQLSLFAGLDTEIFLQQSFPSNWLLAPFVRYYFSLTGITTNTTLSWNESLQAGIAVKYRFLSLAQ
jgi:hypothetical protein